ncbi:TIGR04211 family SH3 domain-containing protein [Pseudoalteromonas sp. JBTF-M23]|uniref:TIGR04211 family SH3 domain-containing protein n=1 Tax=Pseudoalteromonas caenipelagi TaxID=2726988 RepID=A0A849VHV6_9GAMM|nr:TIGR04211 family SH3 domain-containing protein [Pseudoalteromonas caenipelagi]NOU52400.1 TIGR04211 family SH3 domain-containing protein [Pseudoalteromonas caenipelagi]
MLNRIVLPTLLILCSQLAVAQTEIVNEQLPASPANEQSANIGYIIDNLFIYMHAGPGKNYRILGSVDAGTPITILSEVQEDFIQILDDKGREAWVEAKFVTDQPGLTQQLQQANEALQNSQSEVDAIRGELPILQQANNDLRAENQNLQQTITQLQTTLDQQQQATAAKKQKEQHLMLTYGGGITLGGLLFGVILTLLLSRRKRYDGW